MIIFNVDFIYVYFKVLFVEMYVNVVFVESFYNTVTLTRVRTWRSIRIIYDDDDDEDYAHNLLCWHWCSSVYEKACLTRKVLRWILNLDRVGGGEFRRLAGKEFQTDGAMKLSEPAPSENISYSV